MMTAASIPASSAGGYGDYLHSRTVAPAQGDYYVGADGAPTEAAGRWLTSPEALARNAVRKVLLNGSLRDLATPGGICYEGQLKWKSLDLVHHLLQDIPCIRTRGIGVLQLGHEHLGGDVRQICVERPDRGDHGRT